jgi:hypothetical protein
LMLWAGRLAACCLVPAVLLEGWLAVWLLWWRRSSPAAMLQDRHTTACLLGTPSAFVCCAAGGEEGSQQYVLRSVVPGQLRAGAARGLAPSALE